MNYRKKGIAVWVSKETHAKIKEMAKAERRSIGKQLDMIILGKLAEE